MTMHVPSSQEHKQWYGFVAECFLGADGSRDGLVLLDEFEFSIESRTMEKTSAMRRLRLVQVDLKLCSSSGGKLCSPGDKLCGSSYDKLLGSSVTSYRQLWWQAPYVTGIFNIVAGWCNRGG